jgi:undecaprenyl-diphosphatase
MGARVISNLADYGFAWSLLAAAKGRQRGPARRRATRALAVSGVASAAVNTAVKTVVKRRRPAEVHAGSPDNRSGNKLWVRAPTSSSFPSGHTLAAFCTAVVLSDSPGEAVVYMGFAGAVAVSRVYLRAHHASDVVGGAVIGAGLGLVGRQLVRLNLGRRA